MIGERTIYALAAFIILVPGMALAQMPSEIPPGNATPRGPHAPIDINGESELTDFITNGGWGGSGTSSDPYIVRDLTIDSGSERGAVVLANISSHLALDNFDLTVSRSSGVGLLIENSSNVVARDVEVASSYPDVVGIHVDHSSEVASFKADLQNISVGISLTDSQRIRIAGSYIYGNDMGIDVIRSENFRIVGNQVMRCNLQGITVNNSRNGMIEDNHVRENEVGIHLYRSYYLKVYSNTLIHDGFYVDAYSLLNTLDIPTNNSVNSDPLYFYNGDQGGANVPTDAGQVILAGASNLKMRNLNISDVEYGVEVLVSRQITIDSSTIHDCDVGVAVVSGSDLEILGSTVRDNRIGLKALDPYHSSTGHIKVENSRFHSNSFGITSVEIGYFMIYDSFFSGSTNELRLINCGSNEIEGNHLFRSTESGIHLDSVSSSTIIENTIYENPIGIDLRGSDGNTLHSNFIFDNTGYAISLDETSDSNTLYHNSFVDNNGVGGGGNGENVQVEDLSINVWNSNRKEGNHWSEYTSPDTDSDGIVDDPYVIDPDSSDEYPLVEPMVVPISPPLNPKAAGGNGMVNLSWEPPVFNRSVKLLGYNLYRWTGDNDPAMVADLSSEEREYSDTEVENDREYRYHVTAFNMFGESAPTDPVSVKTDGTPPAIRFLSPVNGTYTNESSVGLEWRVNDAISGVKSVWLRMNQGDWEDVTGRTTMYYEFLEDDYYYMDFKAADRVGNVNISTLEFGVDTEKPTLELLAEDNIFHKDSNVTIEWVAEDVESGILRFEYRLNNGTWNEIGLDTFREFGEMADGHYWFDVKCLDHAGNVETDTTHFWVDFSPPEITFTTPSEGGSLNGTDIMVRWEASDSTSWISSVSVALDGRWSGELPGSTREETYTDLEEGGHTVTVRCIDAAGNMRESSLSFSVDTIPPGVTEHGPVGDDLDLDMRIFANFSETMDEDSLDIRVEGIEGEVVLYQGTLRFSPDSRLEWGRTYQVSVEGMDLAGNWMSYSWSFSTMDVAWINGVTASKGKDPLSGVDVYVEGERMFTSSDLGIFNVTLSSGHYNITLVKEGYENYTFDVNLDPGQALDLGKLYLDPVLVQREENGEKDDGGSGSFIWLIILAVLVVFIVLVLLVFLIMRRGSEEEEEKRDETPQEKADALRDLAKHYDLDITGIESEYHNAEFYRDVGNDVKADDALNKYIEDLESILREFNINPSERVEIEEEAQPEVPEYAGFMR